MNLSFPRLVGILCGIAVLMSSAFAQDQFHLILHDQVQTYSANGELERSLDLESDSGLIPGGVAFDSAGDFYSSPMLASLLDGVGHINRYTSSGELLGQWTQLDQTEADENNVITSIALEFDANGLLHAGLNGGGTNDQIERFASDGSSLGIFGETTSGGLLGAIFDIEFDAGGRLYVTDGHNVERFDTEGVNLGVFATTPDMGFANFPTQLEFDSLGNLYLGTIGDWIHVVSPTGEELRQFEIPHGFHSLAISSDDLLYTASGGFGSPAVVNVFDTTGAFQFEFLSVEVDANPYLLITQAIAPEPDSRIQFWYPAVCFASWRRRRASRTSKFC